MASIEPFTEEQARVLINIEQHYDVWVQAERSLHGLPFGLLWRTEAGRDHLHEVLDESGNGRLIGERSPSTEAIYSTYMDVRQVGTERAATSIVKLDESSRIYRALELPMVSSEGARILRETDVRGLLGKDLLVVGGAALSVYSVEAGGRMVEVGEDRIDVDVLWTEEEPEELPIESMRSAVNPVDLPYKEWLLEGRRVSHVLVGRNGSAARVVAPDPRWFALHKLWMSTSEGRPQEDRDKDLSIGTSLLHVVDETMPHMRLDESFESSIPQELAEHWKKWKIERRLRTTPSW
jgi:hypothetical protein